MDIERCRQFAISSLNTARRHAADPAMCHAAPDEAYTACMWAIDYWLRTHHYQPDAGNGWQSMLFQFVDLVPRDDPAYHLYIAALLSGTKQGLYLGWPGEAPPERSEALTRLLERVQRTFTQVFEA